MRRIWLFLLLSALTLAAAEHKAVFPPGVKPVGPYSPGIVAGSLMYVSGQGARDASAQLPAGIEAQIKQCLENVKTILASEKLGLQHVVTAQVYLADMKNYDTLNRVWSQYFPKDPPTRTVIGVVRMPTETPVEITVIAVTDLTKKKVIQLANVKSPDPVSLAISTGDRVYLTGGLGREVNGTIPGDTRGQVRAAVDSAEKVLKRAGLDLRHLVYANIYVDSRMPMDQLATLLDDIIPDETARTIVQTNALPFGAHIQISGLASNVLKRMGGHCTTVTDTTYCSSRVGTTRQTLDSLKADLEAARLDLSKAVASTVFMDDLDQFAEMNKVYGTYFGQAPPTRTTVQPWKRVAELALPPTTGVAPSRDSSPRVQVSIIAAQ